MKLALPAGSTSVIVHVFALDASETTGAGKTALAFSDITAYYVRAGGALTALTLVDITTLGTWDTDVIDDKLGFKLLHDTNAPGLYEVHLPNNILAAGATQVTVQLRATDMAPIVLEIQLAGVDVGQISNDATAAATLELFAEALDQSTGQLDAGSLHDDTITAASINTGALTADAFAADAIVAATLATGVLTADAFAADAIVAATLATGALTADAFAANAITNAAVADDLDVNVKTITAGAITATAIANGALDGKGDWGTSTNLATVAGYLDTEIAEILADTNELQLNQGNWLTATGFSTHSAADVKTAMEAAGSHLALILDDTGTAGVAVSAASKTGYALAATGLDAISATPSATVTTFPQRLMWAIQRFFNSSKTPTVFTTNNDAGVALTTQAVTDDGAGTESLGAPS